jgi:hypothetical protein
MINLFKNLLIQQTTILQKKLPKKQMQNMYMRYTTCGLSHPLNWEACQQNIRLFY